MLGQDTSSVEPVNQDDSLADQIRAGLEYRVLELVIASYRKMSQAGSFNPNWKENKFSAVLTDYIKKHCREFSKLTHQNWFVIREFYHDDEAVIGGEGDPDAVPRIDIVIVTWLANYEEIKFPFECKRIAEKSSTLIRFYVEKGLIERFLTEKNYSAGSPWGGMIGYILRGNPQIIANKLNAQIKRQRNSTSEYLQIRSSIAKFEAIYDSFHQHPTLTQKLKVTHLLLSFPETKTIELQQDTQK